MTPLELVPPSCQTFPHPLPPHNKWIGHSSQLFEQLRASSPQAPALHKSPIIISSTLHTPHIPAHPEYPLQVPTNTPLTNNQFQTELLAIKSSITTLTKSVADLQPKVKEVKAPSTQPTPPAGNPGAQGKGRPPPPTKSHIRF